MTLPSRTLTVPTIITCVFKLPTEKASLIVTTVYIPEYDDVDIVGNHFHCVAKYRPKNVLFRINIDNHGETK